MLVASIKADPDNPLWTKSVFEICSNQIYLSRCSAYLLLAKMHKIYIYESIFELHL